MQSLLKTQSHPLRSISKSLSASSTTQAKKCTVPPLLLGRRNTYKYASFCVFSDPFAPILEADLKVDRGGHLRYLQTTEQLDARLASCAVSCAVRDSYQRSGA